MQMLTSLFGLRFYAAKHRAKKTILRMDNFCKWLNTHRVITFFYDELSVFQWRNDLQKNGSDWWTLKWFSILSVELFKWGKLHSQNFNSKRDWAHTLKHLGYFIYFLIFESLMSVRVGALSSQFGRIIIMWKESASSDHPAVLHVRYVTLSSRVPYTEVPSGRNQYSCRKECSSMGPF